MSKVKNENIGETMTYNIYKIKKIEYLLEDAEMTENIRLSLERTQTILIQKLNKSDRETLKVSNS